MSMDDLCKYMFTIIETIANRAWRVDMFQRSWMFFKEFCLLDTWKKKFQVPITTLSLHWTIYLLKPVYIFARQSSSLLLNMQNVHYLLLD